jgi:hypothetical protein
LATTDVEKGRVDLDAAHVAEKPWLWLQYHVSPGLTHRVDRQVSEDDPMARTDLGHLLELEYARTISIVGAGGIDAFLTSQRWMF